MAIDVLSDVHNQWVKDNEKKFFDPKRENKMYQFMPLSLIGFEEAKSDLLFVEPILKACGYKEDFESTHYGSSDFELTYYDWAGQEDLYNQWNIFDDFTPDDDNPEILIGWGLWQQLESDPKHYVSDSIPDKVADAITGNSELAAKITRQVIEKTSDPNEREDRTDLFDELVEEMIWKADSEEGDEDADDDYDNDPWFTSDDYVNDGWN